MSCGQQERRAGYALGILAPGETRDFEEHLAGCVECREQTESLRATVASFASWSPDVLRPSAALWQRLARRVAAETDGEPAGPEPARAPEPEWRQVAPGISCKLLATDPERHIVSMLVRLLPGTAYPPHTHAGVEVLHLLDGELWIDDRQLLPGDYNHALAGSSDSRVWSETGCTCVLITSTRDRLH